MAKIKLTKSAVDAARPLAQAVEPRDTLVPGLLCKIASAGRKVFMLQYRTNTGERWKPSQGLFRQLDRTEAERLENYVTPLGVRLRFGFAGRRSEIIALEWVDLANRCVVWPDSKTGGMSKPMGEKAYRLLSTAPRRDGCPYVLPSLNDPTRHVTKGEYYCHWSPMLKAVGVAHVGTQGIRHRLATDIANSGISVKVGMALTAHKTVAIFMRYVHTVDKPMLDAAELVANRCTTITGKQQAIEATV